MIFRISTKEIIDIFDDYEEADAAYESYDDKTDLDIGPFDIYDIAETNGLEVVETTTGSNGYPRELRLALTGFESASHLHEVEEMYKMEAVELARRAGHELWNRSHAGYVEPYDMAEVYDDDSNRIYFDEDFLDAEIVDFGEEISRGMLDLEDISERVELFKEIRDNLETIDDTQFVRVHGNDVEVVERYVMSYEYDGTYHCYGLIF